VEEVTSNGCWALNYSCNSSIRAIRGLNGKIVLTIPSGCVKLSWVSGLEQRLKGLQLTFFSAELRYSILLTIPTIVTRSENKLDKKILAVSRPAFVSPAVALNAAITGYITINQVPDRAVGHFLPAS